MSLELRIGTGIAGQTITAMLIASNGSIAASGIACPPIAGALDTYAGNMPALPSDTYTIRFLASGIVAGYDEINWSGSSVITPPTASVPPLVTGWLVALDANGNPLVNSNHYFRMKKPPVGGIGYSFPGNSVLVVSDNTGLVQYIGMFPNTKYEVRREGGLWTEFKSGTTTFNVADCISDSTDTY